MSSRLSCHCFLISYSCLVTLLAVGLAAILGHQSQSQATCDLDPTIVDNEGKIEVKSETTYNLDFFNQHVEEDKVEDTDDTY